MNALTESRTTAVGCPSNGRYRVTNPVGFGFVTLLMVLTGTACQPAAHAADAGPAGPVAWERLTLHDPEGRAITAGSADYHVVCFLGTECPLAKLYAGRLQVLSDRYAEQSVMFLGVNSNLQDSPAEIRDYAADHGIGFPIAKDADQSIANTFGATRTPEVFLIDSLGLVQYRGRIDDQYEPGLARSEPRDHDLRDAIDAVLAGEAVRDPVTESVGCLITRIPVADPSLASQPPVTFTRDVLPVLHRNCVECHREGEIAPFSLTEYDEVVGWGQMLVEVIDQGRMPPWHADPSVGHFVGERRLSSDDRETIAAWVEQGMPEGDAEDAPPAPQWIDGWHLDSPPDLELAMREKAIEVPAEGVVEYQYFVVDPQWSEDRWIRAAQVVAGDTSVVHHAIVFVRPPDGSRTRGIGWLGAYVPGQRMRALPPGHARRIPAGSKLVFQMHYTPNGRVTSDRTRVGVWFADPENVTHEVFTRVAVDNEFEIPPGAKDFPVRMTLDSFPRGSQLLGVTPHMHVRGRSFRLEARREGDVAEPLLHVPRYDFNWQHWYAFAEPLDLDEIESLEMTVTFDNSRDNPVNPAPDEFVTWGDQTWEEMAIAFFDIASKRTSEENAGNVAAKTAGKSDSIGEADRAAKRRQIEQRSDAFLRDMDRNGDGSVQREEAPPAFGRFYFRSMDRNDDGRLDRGEIEAAAAERS